MAYTWGECYFNYRRQIKGKKSMFPVKVETRILLNCPHCRFSSRYDTGFLEDAIHDVKEISCVACGGHFRLSVVAVDRRTTALVPDGFHPVQNSNLEINQTLSTKAVVIRRRKPQ